MEDIWKGAFAPVQKHRLYTGDIRNHLNITYVVRAEEAPDYLGSNSDSEISFKDNLSMEDLVRFGSGRYEWLVGVGFIEGEGTIYHYNVALETPEPLTKEKAKDLIAEGLSPTG